MVRLFIAIPVELPPAALEVYNQIEALGNLVKPASTENLHLTLRFIGEVPNSFIDPISETLTELQQEFAYPARNITLRHLSRFPTNKTKPPRVLFLTIDEDSQHFITEISEKINQALEEMSPSIPRLDRNVIPHLTLARIKDQEKAAKRVEHILSSNFGRELGIIRADRIELVASNLTAGGAYHTTQHEVELDIPPSPELPKDEIL